MFNIIWRYEEENKRNHALTSQILSEKIKKLPVEFICLSVTVKSVTDNSQTSSIFGLFLCLIWQCRFFSEISAFCVNNFIFTTEFYFVLFWKYFGKCKGLVKQGGKKRQHLLRDKFKPPFRQNTKFFIQMLVPKAVWMTILVEGKTHCTSQ